MKKLLILSLLAVSTGSFAQLPYFQREHNSATAGITYAYPTDMHYDGSTRVYSYHASTTGGTVVAKYDATTGAIVDVTYLSKSGASYSPVRVKTQGGNYYAMFNQVISGTTRYCIISLNATTNALNFLRTINSTSGSIDAAGVDFVLDGGNYIYALSNTYDATNSQSDLCITKIDITTLTVVWHNQYQNLSRDEFGSNLIYRSASEIYASAISVNTSSFLDRGPMVLQVNSAGTYVNSKLYKYGTCTSARSAGTWVANGGGNLFLSSISYVGADGNGPFWIAKVDPTTLNVVLQAHYSSVAVYLNPELQGVFTSSGNKVLMSGSASFVNTANPGYTHLFFDAATLAFSSGTLYNTTSSSIWSGDIYDAYINSGTDLNIFSVATNLSNSANYYLLKTSALGDNGCDQPYTVPSEDCVMDHYTMPITTIAVPATLSIIKLFLVQGMNNMYDESCLVTCMGCQLSLNDGVERTEEMSAPYNRSMQMEVAEENVSEVYPNPVTASVTVETSNGLAESIDVYTVTGTLVQSVKVNAVKTVIDLSQLQKGMYLLQINMDGKKKMIKVVKE